MSRLLYLLAKRPGVYWTDGWFGQLHVSAGKQKVVLGQLRVSAAVSAEKQTRRVLDIRLIWAASCLEAVERRNISLTPSKLSTSEYTARPART